MGERNGQTISTDKYPFFKNPFQIWKVPFSKAIQSPSAQDTLYDSQKQKLQVQNKLVPRAKASQKSYVFNSSTLTNLFTYLSLVLHWEEEQNGAL